MVPFPPPTDCGVDGDRTAAGADLAAVQRILRHSDPKLTTEVYAHLAPEYLRAEVDRLSFGAAVLEMVPAAARFDSAPASRALRSGRTGAGRARRGGPRPEALEFATRLLPDPAPGKTKAGTRRAKAQEFRPRNLERETGFEPATLSLGISGVGSRARQLAGYTCPARLGEPR
jgi:integrase